MNREKVNRLLVRTSSICLWTVLIILFLYLPHFFGENWNKKSLNVLVFPQIVDKEYCAAFEKETGVQVNISYFESSEDLITKLHTTEEHGYDLFMIVDFFLPTLVKEGYLKKIDLSKLNFFDDIYPALLNHEFDPGNQYSIPCFWSVYGLGIDLDYFGGIAPAARWSLIFDRYIAPKQIGVPEDLREVFDLAAYYLFGHVDELSSSQIEQVKQLLIEQKKWVAVYTDMRVEYLLVAKTCPVILAANSDVIKVVKKYKNSIRFIVPEEGSFVKIDSYVLPAKTEKDDLVYQFLNYIHQPKIMQKYIDKFEFFPTIRSVSMDQLIPGYSVPTKKMFKKLRFFTHTISSETLEDVWIAIRAS